MVSSDKVKFVYDFFPKEQYAPEYTSVHKAPLTTFDLDGDWMEISEMFLYKKCYFFLADVWWWDVSCFVLALKPWTPMMFPCVCPYHVISFCSGNTHQNE